MYSSPRLLMSLIVIQGVILGLVLMALGGIALRLRRRPSVDLAHALEELRTRQAGLEAAVERLSAARPAESGGRAHPRPSFHRQRSTSFPLRVDPAEPNAVTGPTLITVPSLAATATPATSAATDDLGERFGPICELADTGATPEAIARSTGQPIGQVELILALRRQLAAANAVTHPKAGSPA